MNEFQFFQQQILQYLYKKGSVSTDEIEGLFGGDYDWQNVNNVISNRYNGTSYIYQGYMKYDANNHILTITQKGRTFVESNF